MPWAKPTPTDVTTPVGTIPYSSRSDIAFGVATIGGAASSDMATGATASEITIAASPKPMS